MESLSEATVSSAALRYIPLVSCCNVDSRVSALKERFHKLTFAIFLRQNSRISENFKNYTSSFLCMKFQNYASYVRKTEPSYEGIIIFTWKLWWTELGEALGSIVLCGMTKASHQTTQRHSSDKSSPTHCRLFSVHWASNEFLPHIVCT